MPNPCAHCSGKGYKAEIVPCTCQHKSDIIVPVPNSHLGPAMQNSVTVKETVKETPFRLKKSLSAYNFFVMAKRKELSKDGSSFGDVTRSCAEAWKKLSPDAKKEYETLAQRDKERYESDKQQHPESIKPKQPRKQKQPKKRVQEEEEDEQEIEEPIIKKKPKVNIYGPRKRADE